MIHEKIAFLRKAKNYTHKSMAHQLGIEESEYQRIESGKRKNIPDTLLMHIAELLEVSIEAIKNESPFFIIVNNNDNSFQNNAPFGNQKLENIETVNVLLENQKILLKNFENSNNLNSLLIKLIEKINNRI